MSPSSMRSLFLVFDCVWFVSALIVVQAQWPNDTGPAFPALLAFGDSILDTGNNNLLPTIAKSNFPPYGKDFVEHEPTGRFSNGKVASDLIASKLGIKEVLPAYLSPKLNSQDLPTGVCFASGSSGYDPLTSEVLSVMSLQDQLELFKDYKEKLQATTDPSRAAMIIRESLYIVCSGTNDVANTYFSSPLRTAEYDIPAYTSFLANSASSFLEVPRKEKWILDSGCSKHMTGTKIYRLQFHTKREEPSHLETTIKIRSKDLYNLGARKIAVVGLPPVGCLPSQRTLAGGLQRDCASLHNQFSERYNFKLSRKVQMLQKKLGGATIIYADIYQKLLHLIQHSSNYGFEESNKGCCGTGELEVSVLCNGKSILCSDSSKYVFWDSFHPTEKAYEILVDKLITELLPLML